MWNRARTLRPVALVSATITLAWLYGFATPVGTHAQTAEKSKAASQSSMPARPAPQDVQKMMEGMGPMMGTMMAGMLDGMLTVLAKPETAQRAASFSKNYYDALVAKGFSNDDALKIVMAHGLPMPGGR